MKILNYILVLLIIIPSTSMADNNEITHIRNEYKKIHDAISTFKTIRVELNDYSTDGGGAIAYTDNNNHIRLIKVEFYGESGKIFEEYYYENQLLIFVFQERHKYNVPYYVTPEIAKDAGGVYFDPKKTKVTEDRYYFKAGKMIRWLDNSKSEVDINSQEFHETEKAVLEFSNEVYKKILTEKPNK